MPPHKTFRTPPATPHRATQKQIAQYVSQLDEHIPFLTVRETLEFMHANACVDAAAVDPAAAAAGLSAGGATGHRDAVNEIMSLMHLDGCANTMIGNDLLRG